MSIAEMTSTIADIPEFNPIYVEGLIQQYEAEFPAYFYQMSHGFNILLYGFGSKIEVIQRFCTFLSEKGETIVEVQGFSPSVNIRQVLTEIYLELVDGTPKSMENQLNGICEWLKDHKLYIAIHNIEGNMISNHKSQNVFCILAAAGAHIIASIDHQNAMLIWDQEKAKTLNFVCYECTTYRDYKMETSFEKSLIVSKFCHESVQGGTFSGISFVLSSLTENAKRVYKSLIEYQVSEMKEAAQFGKIKPSDFGWSSEGLYYACVEKFYITARPMFQAILGEFRDHDLIKEEQGNLFAPFDVDLLESIAETL